MSRAVCITAKAQFTPQSDLDNVIVAVTFRVVALSKYFEILLLRDLVAMQTVCG